MYFTSPWLFCNYLFVLLNPLTSSAILPLPRVVFLTRDTFRSNLVTFNFWHFNDDVSWNGPLCNHRVFLKLIYLLIMLLQLSQFLPPLTSPPSTTPQGIPTSLFMFMDHVCKFFGSSISYTVLYIPMAIL